MADEIWRTKQALSTWGYANNHFVTFYDHDISVVTMLWFTGKPMEQYLLMHGMQERCRNAFPEPDQKSRNQKWARMK